MSVSRAGLSAGYGYNGLGDRVSETVNGVTTGFTLDLNTGLTQVLADGTNTYLYGSGRIGQFTGVDSAYFLGDALGSVRQLVDGSGVVTLAQSYEPYGEILSSSGTGQSTYGYTGEWHSSSTNLLYLRSRYYSLYLNQFIQPDTILPDLEKPQSLNLYSYSLNNPVTFSDPSGHWICYVDTSLFINPYCKQWIENGLKKLESSGSVGKNLVGFFHRHDGNLSWSSIGSCAVPPLIGNIWGVKFGFVPGIPARAMTFWPDKIIFNSTYPDFQGSTPPTGDAVVSLGHEITHLSQGLNFVTIQGEILSTIVSYYLENDLNVTHRPDGQSIFDNKRNPWSDTDLEAYVKDLEKMGYGKLPWPLKIMGGIPKNWLAQWGITLPYSTNKP